MSYFIFPQVLSAYNVGICYHCFDNLLFVINLYTAGQFRILRYRFENICGKNGGNNYHKVSKSSYCMYEYKSFKTCVQQHQALIEYCKKLEDVFSVIVLAQVLLFSLLICLDGYLVLMVSKICPIHPYYYRSFSHIVSKTDSFDDYYF